MGQKRGWFKKVRKEYLWPWKLGFFTSPSAWRWRWRRLNLRFSLLDDIAFHVLYFLEAIVLVAGFCFFFLCCGCHI